jgi:predicted ATPase/DNA-binding SARP family transcriptional activator
MWRFRLLGELKATRGDEVVSRFRTQKTASLLAYLAFHAGRAHPREVLIELLWPGGKPEAGRSSLSAALSALRSQLEPPGTLAGSVIVANRATVELAADAFTTDTAAFRAAVEAASRSKGAARAPALRAAVDAYGGELLPGFYQDWIGGERDRLTASFVRAARELARELARSGDLGGAVDAARRAVAADPLSREARTELEALDDASGESRRSLAELDRLEALRDRALAGTVTFLLARGPLPARHEGHVFALGSGVSAAAFARSSDAFSAALALAKTPAAIDTAEVDAGRGYEPRVLERVRCLVALAREGEVLLSEASAALGRRGIEGELADAGLYRLEGARAPERVFLLRAKGAVAEARVGQAPGSTVNAPLELTSFFGREGELERLRELLGGERARLVTITGPGGMGKTRLAVEALRRPLPQGREAAWFVPLAHVGEARSVPAAIVRALRIARGPEREPIERIAEFLGDTPALLVLDNLEQLTDGVADVVRALLERIPALACVATSRVRLAIEGERELALAPLPIVPSLALFLDRARGVRPDFELTPENERDVNELVRRLEGLPLALALAAGRVQVLSPRQIVERLDAPLDLLASPRTDLPERHRTLRSAIAGSYELLAPDLRRFFAALSVFRGGFTLEAAEAVCAEPVALDRLAQLEDASLVTAEDVDGEVRFGLLETLRAFGDEKLSAEERRAGQRRHAEHFLALAERAERESRGPGMVAWLDRLEAEAQNLEGAIEWGLREPSDLAARIAAALVHSWHVRGPVSVGRRLVGAALDRAPGEPVLRARLLSGAALLALLDSDYAAASALQEETLALARASGERMAVARALVNLGLVKMRSSELERALACLDEGSAILRELGAKPGVAVASQNLGSVFFMLGRSLEAEALYRETLELQRSLGDRRGAALARASLGTVALIRGEHARAQDELLGALGELEALGYREAIARTLLDRGVLHQDLGETEAATTVFEESLAISRETGGRIDLALFHLGRIALDRGELDRARALLDESEQRARKIGGGESLACVLTARGELLRRRGELERARASHDESAAIVRATGERPYLAWQLETAAALARDQGETERAARLLAAATSSRDACGHPLPPASRAAVESLRRDLERALGERFPATWESGRALGAGALEALFP